MTAAVDTPSTLNSELNVPAPVELFGLLWDPADTPVGHELAAATIAEQALDPDGGAS